MSGRNYRDLLAWQRAMDLVENIYTATQAFPRDEIYGLTSQVRRAAVSVPSNIAEGQGRTSENEFKHFLSIAHGSVREVETQIMIAQRLKYLPNDQTEQLLKTASETGRLIKGLMNSLREK